MGQVVVMLDGEIPRSNHTPATDMLTSVWFVTMGCIYLFYLYYIYLYYIYIYLFILYLFIYFILFVYFGVSNSKTAEFHIYLTDALYLV